MGSERDLSDVYCYELGAFGLLPWPSYRGGDERISYAADTDRDGLSNLEEELLDTDPLLNDTDGDGLLDGKEVYRYRLDPTVVDDDLDTDGDGLTNVDEADIYSTNPTIVDTDGDSLEDGYEVLTSKTDPTDADTDDAPLVHEALLPEAARGPATDRPATTGCRLNVWPHAGDRRGAPG